jgi:salicylate hydroxylase
MAIESGITLATILRNWASEDLQSAFAFYKSIRKPRTDKITRTSYEAGLLASADLPESMTTDFNPEALRNRMKWIMEEDVQAQVMMKGAPFFKLESSASPMSDSTTTGLHANL